MSVARNGFRLEWMIDGCGGLLTKVISNMLHSDIKPLNSMNKPKSLDIANIAHCFLYRNLADLHPQTIRKYTQMPLSVYGTFELL